MPKNKTNPFMSFALEWKSIHGKNMSIQEAIKRTGPLWEKMNTEQRLPYSQRSRKQNTENRKMDCLGRKMSDVENQRNEIVKNELSMKRNIENTVKKSIETGELTAKHYYFMMVNYFFKTQSGNYVPAELAIAKFSLKDGVCKKYHTLINSDVNMFGYQYEAQEYVNSTHLLPLPPKALGEREWSKIYQDIIEFIGDPHTNVLPPIYTHRDNIAEVRSVLNMLNDFETSNNIDVYSIQYLFFVLKEACAEIGEVEKPSSIFITDAVFERDFFEYQIGISCAFHEEKDRSKYCTLSYVTRWGYQFSNYMCDDVAITPIPGRHIPVNVALNGETIIPVAKPTRQEQITLTESGTDPIWDHCMGNATEAVTTVSAVEFPSLGATRKKKASAVSTPNAHIKLEEEIVDDEVENPWNSRSKSKKDNNSPTVSNSFGRGRKIGGYGRGQLFS